MRVRKRRRGDWSVKNESGSYTVTHHLRGLRHLLMRRETRRRVERTRRMEEIRLHLTRISKCTKEVAMRNWHPFV